MDQEKQVEVSVVLGYGDFSLRLNSVTMNVRVQNAKGGANTVHLEAGAAVPSGKGAGAVLQSLPAPGAADPTAATQLAAEVAYYRQTSQEIYEGLGKLAKEINLSIQDLSLAEILQTSMTSPGERLDQVRSQVNDVLEMTEKATLNILNLVEHIQEDCLKVQGQIRQLAGGEMVRQFSAPAGPREASPLWSQLLTQGEALDRLIRANFQDAESPQTAPPHFALRDVLQLLLEFCGAEAVKPHLKSVLGQYENLFRVGEAEQSLQHLAVELPQEDGFYQFPVDKVLESLNAACTDEQVKKLFTKLMASAPKIFPIGTLPVEAQPSGSTPEAGPLPEVLAHWQEFFAACQNLAKITQESASTSAAAEGEGGSGEVVQEALDTMERINSSLSGITEALAFQDLSGQRLLKVLKILRQLQVQVLTLLVAAGNKLKGNIEGQEISFSKTEISAQEELDRLLHILTQASQAPSDLEQVVSGQGPLDQEAVNDLLTGMGF
jgi:chemotaxis regulatin CheY-phosphate phosphatase CheZ